MLIEHPKIALDTLGLQRMLALCFDSSPMAVFAIDARHDVVYWNRACEFLTGHRAECQVGTQNHWQAFYKSRRPLLADLIVSGADNAMLEELYRGKVKASEIVPNTCIGEDYYPQLGESGKWLMFSGAPVFDERGQIVAAIQSLFDVTQRKLAEINLERVKHELESLVARRTSQLETANRELADDIVRREQAETMLIRRNEELVEANERLSRIKEQLMQSEKMASIGQLAAGVAHEINNPIGFVFSNFGSLDGYLVSLFEVLDAYAQLEQVAMPCAELEAVRRLRERVELDFLRDDIPQLMRESREGIARVRKIVQDLKDFSRIDATQEWQRVNVEDGILSTLNILASELKYRADVETHLAGLPDIECYPSQINQVVMNLVANAAQAMDNRPRGRIVVRTGYDDLRVWIEVEDNGTGIAPENLSRIFDPFFTTKPVGKGTGLGLWLSYGIVQKHGGQIDVQSEPGQGTCFRINLPRTHGDTEISPTSA